MPQPTPQTIKLTDLSLVIALANVRASNSGKTCLLAATTPAPMLSGECRYRRAPARQAMQFEQARQTMQTMQTVFVGPMQRGHIARLIERVSAEQGGREVRATWGATMKTLLAEPRYVLNGGAA